MKKINFVMNVMIILNPSTGELVLMIIMMKMMIK